jgi:cytochrome c-type biogenesis protein CcmH
MKYLLQLTLIWIALSVLAPAATSQVDTFEFETPEQQQRFRKISDELRCPMCQNTSLSGSTGGVAEDLRREIHRMIIEGLTDQEIEQFMFERYGDFIFYKPRLTPETLFLWFGPLLFLLVGGLAAFAVWRRARSTPNEIDSLNSDETQRLNKLLNKS